MNEIVTMALKDLRLLVRDKAGFFFTFIFPILYASLFGTIMSGFSSGDRGGMEVAIVDEDNSAESEAFITQLEGLKELKVSRASREQAMDAVRRGRQAAYVVLTPGFGEARKRIFWGEPAKIEIGVDPARQAESGLLQGLLTAQLYEGFQEAFTDPDVMGKQIDGALAELEEDDDMEPVARMALRTFLSALKGFMNQMPREEMQQAGFEPAVIETTSIARQRTGPDNAYEIAFPQGVVWGVMGCAAGFGISLVVERRQGTLVRLRMAPISRTQILAGKALACLFTTLCVGIILYIVAIAVFGVRPDSVAKLVLAVTCVAVGFVGIMMLLSVLGKTEQSAGGIGWAVLLVLAMIGGGMVPLAFLPGWLQSLASVSPIKWAILAMEGAVWRNFSYREMVTPCVVLLGIGVGGFSLGARAFRWTG